LRKRPAVPSEVLGGVLALAVGVVDRIGEDARAALSGMLAVTVCVSNAHQYGVSIVRSTGMMVHGGTERLKSIATPLAWLE
jgi:hypothetical protein